MDAAPVMDRVLITGGAGFIGSNLIPTLLRLEPTVHIFNLDALTYAGTQRNLEGLPDPSRHEFIHGDITDQPLVETLLRTRGIGTIVNLAAETHVDRSIYGPAPFVYTNVVGTFTLLEAARNVWLGPEAGRFGAVRFHHVSTDEVYGPLGEDEPPCSEDRRYRPSSPYAASKAAADHLVRSYARTYRLPATISNCSNNYGARQYPEKLIPLMLHRAMRGEPLPIYGDGRQVRDWIYVEDHCEGLIQILRRGRNGETYHLGGGNQVTNLDLVQLLCALLDEALPHSPHRPHAQWISFIPDRPGHDQRYALDIRKIGEELGWKPRESLESGLRKTVMWYLQNANWMEAIASQPSYGEWMERHYAARSPAG